MPHPNPPNPTPNPDRLTRKRATIFAKAVRNMGAELAREAWQPSLRLLDLLRRDKVLVTAASRAARDDLARSPLRQLRVNGAPFHLPVCFADAPPQVWGRAAELAARGVPLSLERSDDGRRRGLPWDDVILAANEEGMIGGGGGGGGAVSAVDVLAWIEEATRAVPARLREHPDPKLARIPMLRDRIELSVRRLVTCELQEACAAYAERFDGQLAAAGTRFTAWIDARTLSELFARAATRATCLGERTVTLGGVGNERSPGVTCHDLRARAAWGTGHGVASVRVEDLKAAAVRLMAASQADPKAKATLFVGDPGWLVVPVGADGQPAAEACQFKFAGLE